MWVWLLRCLSGAAMVAVVYGGYLAYERQAAWTLAQKAEVTARAWLDHFTLTVPDFPALLATGVATPAQQAALAEKAVLAEVFRYKLFDAQGRVTYVSDDGGRTIAGSAAGATPDAEASAMLRAGAPLVMIEDGSADPERPASYGEVYLPVRDAGQTVGAMEIYVDTTAQLAAVRASFLNFAGILCLLFAAAVAIPSLHWLASWRAMRRKNADLRAAQEALEAAARSDQDAAAQQMRLAREVRLIGELNEWLQSSRSQAELFDMVSRALSLLMPDARGEIYVYSNSRDVLDGSAGWNGATPADHIHPADCWALRRGRTYVYGTTELAFRCHHGDGPADEPALCYPLLAHGETVGLLHLRPRDAADADAFMENRKLAQLCAEQISMAIANVRMRDTLQEQSIRDPLTGLFNRRHLTETLRRVMARADRTNGTVALLSIDVDHFKTFNDNHGHDAGDMVLRAVGEVLHRAVDGDELAFRPGGEEFMIVLPGADTAEALTRAEAVREDIQDISIRYGEKTLPGVTASIGIALSPRNGTMPQELMQCADDALYGAKAAGRNRVMLSELIDLTMEDGSLAGAGRTAPDAGPIAAE